MNQNPQSQIQYVDSQTREPRPDVDIGSVLVSSEGMGWQGIHIETGENDGFTSDNVTVAQHYFAMNIGAPYRWEWKDGDRFKTERSEPGNVWVNPAGVPFSHRVYGYNQFALLTLSHEWLEANLPEGVSIEPQQFRREHHSVDPQIQHLMQALMVEAADGGQNGQLYASMLAAALSIHYTNHYGLEHSVGDRIDLSSVKVDDRKRIRKVLDYIESFLSEDISLNDLALVSGRSKFHFCRLFKSAVGETPHQYLMRRRVERAALALKDKSKTLTTIALDHGFSDQTHFTRNFRKIKGITPGGYREELL